ncbi:hypothetical protein MKW94_019798 [Papaver nudicaule]|uniref:Signal peptidase complex subunit 3 n=1 Tax=Papaver nudicaule TaxID=74823 RepID=A0AA41V3I5_PAPNU|nr:hypothetical protein [Papaver nudicaule]
MHSFGNRLNTLLTFSALLLAVLCILTTTISSNFNEEGPPINAQYLSIFSFDVNRLRKQLSGNDEVILTLNISADLRSAFTWNTKQAFVFVAAEYETAKNSVNQEFMFIKFRCRFVPKKKKELGAGFFLFCFHMIPAI